jgi:small subunit ribosomal protein S16
MLKLRLKRNGRKRQPAYRLVVMESASRRNGRPIDEIGYYNPITKESYFNQDKIIKWLKYGVQPTETVFQLLKKSNLIVDKKA